MPKVLFLSYFFPPINGSGTFRSAKFAKYLPEFDWLPTVITTDPETAHLPRDDTLNANIGSGTQVYRVSTPHFPRKLARGPLWKLSELPPDEQFYWSLRILPLARRLIQEEKIPLIYSSSAPWSILITAMLLRKTKPVRWVADFRDPWLSNIHLYRRGGVSKRIDQWLEVKALHAADQVLTTTHPIAEELEMIKGGHNQKVNVIPNGFESSDFVSDSTSDRENVITFIHPGALLAAAAEPFLNGLDFLLKRFQTENRFIVRFVGWQELMVRQRIESSRKLSEVVSMEDYVSHTESIRHMTKSSVLLLLLGSASHWKRIIAGKSFEYMASGKPILAVTQNGVTADLIRTSGTGCVVDPGDPEEIARMLRFCIEDYDGFKRAYYRPKWEYINQFERKRLTGQLADVFDKALAD